MIIVLVWAIITEYHKLVACKEQKFISHKSESWKSEIRVSA